MVRFLCSADAIVAHCGAAGKSRLDCRAQAHLIEAGTGRTAMRAFLVAIVAMIVVAGAGYAALQVAQKPVIVAFASSSARPDLGE
jgi:hypothetical protein